MGETTRARFLYLLSVQALTILVLLWDSLLAATPLQDWNWVWNFPLLGNQDFLIILGFAILYALFRLTPERLPRVFSGGPLTLAVLSLPVILGYATLGHEVLLLQTCAIAAVFLVQVRLLESAPVSGFFFAVLNFLPMLFLWVDGYFFKVTRGHLNLYHLKVSLQNPQEVQKFLSHSIELEMGLRIGAFLLLLYLTSTTLRAIPSPVSSAKQVAVPVLLGVLCWLGIPSHAYPSQFPRYLALRVACLIPLPDLPPFKTDLIRSVAVSPPIRVERALKQGVFQVRNGREGAKRNLVVIWVESLRSDLFETLMKRTAALAQTGLFLRRHFANANCTPISMMSFYTGIYPLDLSWVFHEAFFPSLLTFLKGQGYRLIGLRAIEETSQVPLSTNPEVENSFFPLSEDGITSSRKVLEKTLEELNKGAPCFIQAYLYNTHWPYYFPPDFAHHQPILEGDIPFYNYVEPSFDAVTKIANRYKNSLLYMDEMFTAFFREAKSRGIMDNTVFVVVGDHGESLGENGFLGHFNSPMLEQFRVPCFVLAPGVASKTVETPTEHVDLIPTLGRYLNYDCTGLPGLDVLTATKTAIMHMDSSISQVNKYFVSRLLIREGPFMSIFDYFDDRLNWNITTFYDYALDGRPDGLYSMKENANLAGVIRRDMKTALSRLRQN